MRSLSDAYQILKNVYDIGFIGLRTFTIANEGTENLISCINQRYETFEE